MKVTTFTEVSTECKKQKRETARNFVAGLANQDGRPLKYLLTEDDRGKRKIAPEDPVCKGDKIMVADGNTGIQVWTDTLLWLLAARIQVHV